MHYSPSSHSREEFEELQEVIEALYEESIKMVKRNMELKSSIKKVILEEALDQRVASMENKVVSPYEERKINTSLKEELARQKEENTKLLKEK